MLLRSLSSVPLPSWKLPAKELPPGHQRQHTAQQRPSAGIQPSCCMIALRYVFMRFSGSVPHPKPRRNRILASHGVEAARGGCTGQAGAIQLSKVLFIRASLSCVFNLAPLSTERAKRVLGGCRDTIVASALAHNGTVPAHHGVSKVVRFGPFRANEGTQACQLQHKLVPGDLRPRH